MKKHVLDINYIYLRKKSNVTIFFFTEKAKYDKIKYI